MSLETHPRELMARAIHERYRENQQRMKPPDDPVMQPWNALPEHVRESNRRQADDIAAILATIGCAVRPAGAGAPVPLVFTQDEVEIMAAVVHEHWVDERVHNRWTPGPRDVGDKTTPYLVPYAELPEDVKEWDRQAVAAIPEVLAAAGLEAYRPE